MAMGGILRWKDGRNMPELQRRCFEYGSLPVYSAPQPRRRKPEVVRFQGSKGILEVGSFR